MTASAAELTMPTIIGVGVGEGVLEAVGGIGVIDGVNVKVGSGVREDSGVAVYCGVWLRIGASVSVGLPALCDSPPCVQALRAAMKIKVKKSFCLFMATSIAKTRLLRKAF